MDACVGQRCAQTCNRGPQRAPHKTRAERSRAQRLHVLDWLDRRPDRSRVAVVLTDFKGRVPAVAPEYPDPPREGAMLHAEKRGNVASGGQVPAVSPHAVPTGLSVCGPRFNLPSRPIGHMSCISGHPVARAKARRPVTEANAPRKNNLRSRTRQRSVAPRLDASSLAAVAPAVRSEPALPHRIVSDG